MINKTKKRFIALNMCLMFILFSIMAAGLFIISKDTAEYGVKITIEGIYTQDENSEIIPFEGIDELELSQYYTDKLESSIKEKMVVRFLIVMFIFLILLFILVRILSTKAMQPMEEVLRKQKEFIADASHELKTPLAVISANVGVIMSNENETVKSQEKWLSYIHEEVQHMNDLVKSLLYLAKIERDDSDFQFSSFNFSELVTGTCLSFEVLAFEQEKKLEMDIADDIYVTGDEHTLRQVVIILLDNAVKYSYDHGTIKVKVFVYKSKIYFSVVNSGEGIKTKNPDKIFERFYRVDESRAKESGGFGLGLSIAKAIVEQHNGTITSRSEIGKETQFNVILPTSQKTRKKWFKK